MPQLNPEFFVSQLFWLVCFFLAMYVYLRNAFIPKVTNVLQTREKKVKHDLAAAEKIMLDCQKLLLEAESTLENAKEQASQARLQAAQQAKTTAIEQTAALEEKLQNKFAAYEKNLLYMREKLLFELGNEAAILEEEVWKVMHLSLQNPTAVNGVLKN